MDLAIRQMLQMALQQAIAAQSLIAITRTNGELTVVQCDLVCYENYVEATDQNGQLLTIPYSQIDSVEAAQSKAASH